MGAVSSVADAVSDIGQSVVDTVSDVGASVDDAVNDVIPGGWATVASVAVPTAAPYIVAANTLDKGGSLEDALTNAAISYGIGQVAQNIGAPEAGSLDAGPGAYDVSEYLAPVPTGIEALTPTAEPFVQTEGGLYTLPEEVAKTQLGSVAETGLTAPTGLESIVPPVAPVTPAAPTTPEPFVQTDGGLYTLPEEVATTQAGTVAQTGLNTPSPGIFQSIADATGLPLGLVSTLGTGLGITALGSVLAPDQPSQAGASGTPQSPVGVGLSPDYQPYRYKPYAMGGLTALAAGGGPVEMMSNANAVGANTGFPMANIARGAYATPYQQPISQNVLSGSQDTRVDPYTGQERLAGGGLSDLGAYSDGGRLLRGPGDGVSDSIPAVIGGKQPARLADGEFVIPARIVSELGNGSTEAGARQLYAMMDRIQKARAKTVGKNKVATNTKATKHLPA
jgi:hypothetical protein